MDCATFKDLAALFALGALSAEERRACEAHLADPRAHDGCFAVLSAAAEAVSALDGDAATPTPPAHVWTAIETRVMPAARRAQRLQRRNRIWMTATVACAAALTLVFLQRRDLDTQLASATRDAATKQIAASTLQQERDACRGRVDTLERAARANQLRAEAVSLLQLPGTQLFALAQEKNHKATANGIIHTGVKRVFVVADGLPHVDGHDYEMWIARRGKVVAAGVVETDDAGRAVFRIDYDKLLEAEGAPEAVMITLEPHGGNLATPGPTVLLGTIRS